MVQAHFNLSFFFPSFSHHNPLGPKPFSPLPIYFSFFISQTHQAYWSGPNTISLLLFISFSLPPQPTKMTFYSLPSSHSSAPFLLSTHSSATSTLHSSTQPTTEHFTSTNTTPNSPCAPTARPTPSAPQPMHDLCTNTTPFTILAQTTSSQQPTFPSTTKQLTPLCTSTT